LPKSNSYLRTCCFKRLRGSNLHGKLKKKRRGEKKKALTKRFENRGMIIVAASITR